MITPKQISATAKAYEKKKLAAIDALILDINRLMGKGADKAARLIINKKLINNRFLPLEVRKAIDRIVTTFHADVTDVIINGINRAKILADQKNTLLEKGYMGGGRKPPTRRTQISSDFGGGRRRPPKSPINPSASGFGKHFSPSNLSPRVWKLSNVYKATIKSTLVKGLRDGTSAKDLAKVLVKNLRNPQGTPSPGQGVYQSPRKNAERLARTEINLAYEWADFDRWQTLWFVIGIEVRLSASHPKYDICDQMVGQYPKDFLFPGWHPNCLCVAVPVMADEETRDKMLDFDLGIIDKKPEVNYVETIPEAAQKWITDNSERIKGWKSKPYFLKYNDKYLSQNP
jgi:hypothetical protein